MLKRTELPPTHDVQDEDATAPIDADRDEALGEPRRGPRFVRRRFTNAGAADTAGTERRGGVLLGGRDAKRRRGGRLASGLAVAGLVHRWRARRRDTAYGDRRGARAGRFGSGRGMLPALVGLILLVALVAAGIALLAHSDGGSGASKRQSEQSKNRPKSSPTSSSSAPSSSAGAAGALSIGGQTVRAGSSLRGLIGKDASVENAKVVQVDPHAGFFIGGGKGHRTFVEYGSAAGGSEGRPPKLGDVVNVKGPVTRPPKQPGRTFHVRVPIERVILKQGGYINAESVTPAR